LNATTQAFFVRIVPGFAGSTRRLTRCGLRFAFRAFCASHTALVGSILARGTPVVVVNVVVDWFLVLVLDIVSVIFQLKEHG
jgi:hypothetical protein